MRKKICCMLAVCMLSGASGCGCTTNQSENSRQELDVNAVVTSDPVSQETEPPVVSGTQIAMASDALYGQTYEAGTSDQEFGNIAGNENGIPVGANGNGSSQPSSAGTSTVVTVVGGSDLQNVYGVAGKTEEEWMMYAQEQHFLACETAYRYLYAGGAAYSFSSDVTDTIDYMYFRTTCTSWDEATAAYYEVFSRAYHASDFDGILVEQDGKIYASRGARGMDITYLSSTVERVESMSDTEIVFTVLNEYEGSETEDTFSMVLEDGVWKVGTFRLPY